MGKQLVCVDNLDSIICPTTGRAYADGSVILTPGAKDELSRRGVAIVYGPRPATCPSGCTCPACTGGLEPLLQAVTAILRQHHPDCDDARLRTLGLQVLNTLRDAVCADGAHQ